MVIILKDYLLNLTNLNEYNLGYQVFIMYDYLQFTNLIIWDFKKYQLNIYHLKIQCISN